MSSGWGCRDTWLFGGRCSSNKIWKESRIPHHPLPRLARFTFFNKRPPIASRVVMFFSGWIASCLEYEKIIPQELRPSPRLFVDRYVLASGVHQESSSRTQPPSSTLCESGNNYLSLVCFPCVTPLPACLPPLFRSRSGSLRGPRVGLEQSSQSVWPLQMPAMSRSVSDWGRPSQDVAVCLWSVDERLENGAARQTGY